MSAGDLWQIIALTVCVFFSSFFSASETALMSLSKVRLRNMVEEEVAGAGKLQKLVESPRRLLGAILIGNNVVNIGASALATALAIKHFGSAGVGIATIFMTVLILIFAETTPKSLSADNPEKMSLRVANLLSILVALLSPLTIVLMHVTRPIIKLLGGKVSGEQPFITEEELKTMINVGHEEGVLEVEEKTMIHNVFEFGESRVIDVMTPRVHMVAVEVHSSYDRITEVFKRTKYSRLPVYEDKIDNIVGLLFLKDLAFLDADGETLDITKYMREPFFTYEFKLITHLFGEMRDKRIQMAVVLDEYGGTAGLVTMGDLVEEIVGDICDEFDDLSNEIETVKEGEYVVRGTAKVELIEETIGVSVECEAFETIGGFVTGLFGRIPKAEERVEHNNAQFIVESVSKYRIEKIRILT